MHHLGVSARDFKNSQCQLALLGCLLADLILLNIFYKNVLFIIIFSKRKNKGKQFVEREERKREIVCATLEK